MYPLVKLSSCDHFMELENYLLSEKVRFYAVLPEPKIIQTHTVWTDYRQQNSVFLYHQIYAVEK
jgi:hypothetical protein